MKGLETLDPSPLIKVFVHEEGDIFIEFLGLDSDVQERVSGIMTFGDKVDIFVDPGDCSEFYQGTGITRFRGA